MMDIKLEAVKGTAKSNHDIATETTRMTIALLVVGVVISLLLGLFIASTITRPIAKIRDMIKEMSLGHLGMRLYMDSLDEVGEMATAMDHFADDLQNVVIKTIQQISDGDLSAEIEQKDEADEIIPALKQTIKTVRDLIAESTMLAQAAVDGKLQIRGDANAFKGGFREILVGFNDTLDALVTPLNVAASYVEQIGNGVIPEKIDETYYGDFDTFKNISMPVLTVWQPWKKATGCWD
jgi:Signal transduction histidine kinase